MNDIAVVTTFPSCSWEIYAKAMLESYAKFWPHEIPLLVNLDDDLLFQQVDKILPPQGGICVGWSPEHKAFVERNKGKDEPQNYRKQAVRFCHKVFAIKGALDAIEKNKSIGQGGPRYLIWMDADVITNKPVTMEMLKECLPKEGDAVAYMGRKDWDHSECGWLAFDLENGGNTIIDDFHKCYLGDAVMGMDQWHDSWVFDQITFSIKNKTNLTLNKPGMDIWQHSPMAKWSTHHKGPIAKNKLSPQEQKLKPNKGSNVVIQTKNALPNEEICKNIATNQLMITNWIRECKWNDEEIVVVSAGPMLVAEDLREEVKAGRRIVAVKHAMEPLKKAGIKPWACILLDPRLHVSKFVDNPDTEVIWFVASQVQPEVTRKLLDAGCKVWGYHAPVGAGEDALIEKQQYAAVTGGSATATRGLFVLKALGFSKFRLYGYDLCWPEKPNLAELTPEGQPKYMEISIGIAHTQYKQKRCFWMEPQFLAQFEEINDIIKTRELEIKAFGDGVIPFVFKAKETGELRAMDLKARINKNPPTYERLLGCSNRKIRMLSLTSLARWSPLRLLKRKKITKF